MDSVVDSLTFRNNIRVRKWAKSLNVNYVKCEGLINDAIEQAYDGDKPSESFTIEPKNGFEKNEIDFIKYILEWKGYIVQVIWEDNKIKRMFIHLFFDRGILK